MLAAERERTRRAVIAELERLCGQSYFTTTGQESGLRVAISAVKRMGDSADLRVADPDEPEYFEVWDELPHDLGTTRRRTLTAALASMCHACSRPYRKAAAGSYVCVHTAVCARARKLVAAA
jgi:hypothetical protein